MCKRLKSQANIRQLEEAVIAKVRRGGYRIYEQVCEAYQTRWLKHHREEYQSICWQKIKQITPFGLTEISNRESLLGLPPLLLEKRLHFSVQCKDQLSEPLPR